MPGIRTAQAASADRQCAKLKPPIDFDAAVHTRPPGGICDESATLASSAPAVGSSFPTAPGHNSVLAWLPDGKIGFVSFHGPNNFEIYVMNAEGSGLRNLTRELGLDGIPVWSPDGQKIAFTSKRDGTWGSTSSTPTAADSGG